MKIIAIFLILFAVLLLVLGGFNDKRDSVADVGPLRVDAHNHRIVPIAPHTGANATAFS